MNGVRSRRPVEVEARMGGPAHEAYPGAPSEDSVNANDPVSKVERRDHAVRQKLVKLEMAKVRTATPTSCRRRTRVVCV